MANAREQARNAAAAELLRSKVLPHDARNLADAASDVWEPLLREVFEYLQDKHPGDFSQDCGGCSLTLKIKEVLGE